MKTSISHIHSSVYNNTPLQTLKRSNIIKSVQFSLNLKKDVATVRFA